MIDDSLGSVKRSSNKACTILHLVPNDECSHRVGSINLFLMRVLQVSCVSFREIHQRNVGRVLIESCANSTYDAAMIFVAHENHVEASLRLQESISHIQKWLKKWRKLTKANM